MLTRASLSPSFDQAIGLIKACQEHACKLLPTRSFCEVLTKMPLACVC